MSAPQLIRHDDGVGATGSTRCACAGCYNLIGPSKHKRRCCSVTCRVADCRAKREAVTAPLRAIAALLGVRMTLQQALDILDRCGLTKVARWLGLWGFQWTNGRWAVVA